MARARPVPKPAPEAPAPAANPNPWASQAAAQYNPEEDLKAIVAATVAGGFLYRDPNKITAIAEFVETNPEMTNEAGEMATRATDAGVARANATAGDGSYLVTMKVNGGVEPAISVPVGNFEIDTDVALIPATRGRNAVKRPEIYPFDALLPPPTPPAPPHSFWVAPMNGVGVDQLKEQARKFSVTVSNANSRYKVETGEQETVVVTDYQIGANGKLVKDANNKWIKIGEHQETRPVRKPTRTFQLRIVGADDKRGPGLRVFRTL